MWERGRLCRAHQRQQRFRGMTQPPLAAWAGRVDFGASMVVHDCCPSFSKDFRRRLVPATDVRAQSASFLVSAGPVTGRLRQMQ
jgi:hypothetical protein